MTPDAPFAHTPYDGRATPFSIGLKPIPPARWIEPDTRLLPELAEKDAHFAQRREVVFRERGDTRAAQGELLDLLAAHLLSDHPALYSVDGAGTVTIAGERRVRLNEPGEPPIIMAARLVQDDLVLMRQGADGWRLVAAALCFPSTWSLAEKFDQPMEAIHRSVPGFNGPMSATVNRIFDRLPEGHLVERLNWSIYGDDRLHHPETKSGPRPWQGLSGGFAEQAFVRVERQTLRRLPRAGDIVFTIKVVVDPVAAFRLHPDGKALAKGLHDQLATLTPDQLAYKNMLADRDLMLDALAAIARV